MVTDLRLDWNEVCRNPDDFERLVKMLLLRMFPDGEVIDGSGGDGGREFQIRDADTVTLYEAKSFTGRVSAQSPKRRPQVEASLARAAKLNPTAWNLVVPVDHNPSELAWFDKLRGRYPFPLHWLGLTWLEEHLARYDDLVRHAVSNKLLELARHFRLETDALAGGVPDLLDRQRNLARLGDTLSPHWRPIIGVDRHGIPTLQLQAKHKDADKEAPITVRFTAAIPNTSGGRDLQVQLQAAIEFGTSVEIPGRYISAVEVDGPPELHLPRSGRRPHHLVLSAAPQTTNLPEQTLAVYEPGAPFPLATLGFRPVSRTSGKAGVRLVARDLAHTVELVTLLRRDGTVTFQFRAGHDVASMPVLPSALLPGLRLLRALRSPNRLLVTVCHGDEIGTMNEPVPVETDFMQPVPDDVADFIENLAVIQDKTRQPFPLPPTVTANDIAIADTVRRLLDGDAVHWSQDPLKVFLRPDGVAEFATQFPPGSTSHVRLSNENYEVRLCGQLIHLGPVYMVAEVVASVMPAVPAITGTATPPDEEPWAIFTVVDGDWFIAHLGEPHPPADASLTSG